MAQAAFVFDLVRTMPSADCDGSMDGNKTVKVLSTAGNLIAEFPWEGERHILDVGMEVNADGMYLSTIISKILENMEEPILYKSIHNPEDYIVLLKDTEILSRKDLILKDYMFSEGEKISVLIIVFYAVPECDLVEEAKDTPPRSYYSERDRYACKAYRRYVYRVVINYPPPPFWNADGYLKLAIKIKERYNSEMGTVDEDPPDDHEYYDL